MTKRIALLSCLLLTACGCHDKQFTATIVNPLNLDLPFLPHRDPVRVGIVEWGSYHADMAAWQANSPWTPFRQRLQLALGVPVQIVEVTPFQAAAHLRTGQIDLTYIPAGAYVEMSEEDRAAGKALAVTQPLIRQGLIVADSRSDIARLEDIKGKRFSFGPQDDPVLDVAAKKALQDAGVSLDDVQRELFPLPGSFQHHTSSRASAYQIVYALTTQVGVIDKSDYDEWPDKAGSALLRRFSKEDVRVLGETERINVARIPQGVFVISGAEKPAMAAQISDFLLSAGGKEANLLSAIGVARFDPPPEDLPAQLRQMAATDNGLWTRATDQSGGAGDEASPPPE